MKTIFFTLFSTNVYNNFLIFPESVLKRLAASRRVKVVILSDKNFAEPIKKYNLGENVVVETVKDMPQRNWRQSLFYFFYSYLIFTDTTRLLATFGARADAPPAGGNRHLSFLKSAVANTFGRSLFVKTKLVPRLYKRIFHSRPYRYLFEKYKPDLVFLSHLAFFPDVEILAEAQRNGVRTVGMPSNWDHLNKYYIPLHADYLLVQNEPMKKEAIEWHNYKEEQVTVVGFPQFDFYIHGRSFLKTRADFLKEYGFAPASKIILFISGSVYFLDEKEILETILKWAREGKFGAEVNLIMRPYPARISYKDYGETEKKEGIYFFWDKLWDNLEGNIKFLNMMYHADVVISVFSTTAMEVAAFDKPAITLGFDGSQKRPAHQSVKRLERLSHFQNVLETGAVRIARAYGELFAAIDEYLKEPRKYQEKCDILKDKLCYRLDGEASRRVAEFILKESNG